MKIITKKAYCFTLYNGLQRMKTVMVEPYVIKAVPDWVEKDPLFGLALKAGNASVIGSAGSVSLDAVDAVMAEAKQLGIKNPGSMTIDQLQQTIVNIKQEKDANDKNSDNKPTTKSESAADSKGKKSPAADETINGGNSVNPSPGGNSKGTDKKE